jgi:UDP-2-acetamido-3-amino-2,3-dideoxy-glucuronate N-acetyltransferase
MSPEHFFIHETAIVEDGALIGRGAQVWHHAQVRAGARIGAETRLGKNVYVDAGVVIGARTKIQNDVSVYAGVSIDDEVFIGPGAVFTNDRVPRAFGEWEPTATAVRHGASIGANATIVCGVAVGEFAMIAAGAVVVRSVAAHELVAGNPAAHLGWTCRCGRTTSRADERPQRLWCGTCSWDEP